MKKFPLVLLCCVALSGIMFSACSKNKTSKPVYLVDCADSLVGIYSGSDYCSSSGQPAYQCSVTAQTDTNIMFSNLASFPVSATLNCAKNTITIPTQTFAGNFTITGTGTFSANRIIINWNGTSMGIPFSCNTTLTR